MEQHKEVELGPVLPQGEGTASQWRLPRPAVVLLGLLLFVGIFVLRIADHNPADAVLVLLVVPIALCAVEFGPLAGLAAALLGLALAIVWDLSQNVDVGPL